ncbi:MAG: GxxExxY protein [Anaerolineales bacterium]
MNHEDTKSPSFLRNGPGKIAHAQYVPIPSETERIATLIVDAAYTVHTVLGAGLLESVYEPCFCYEIQKRGLKFERQVVLPIIYDGVKLDNGFRLDVLVEGQVICELKAVAELAPVHQVQLLTYLKLANKRLGFLINFNVPLIKDGIKRMVL